MPTSTTNYGFTKPDAGQPNWAATLNATIDAIDAALEAAVISGGSGGSSSANSVSYSATPIFNKTLGSTQVITLTGNVTSSSVSNAAAGVLTLVIIQDSVGGHSFVFPSNFRGSGVISAAYGTATANSYATQSFVYVPSTSQWVAITQLIYGE